MKLSEYLKQNGMTSKDYFDMQKRKASGKTTLTDYRRNQVSSLKNKIGLDTFESDLKTVGTTVDDIYKGWQPKETMENTRSTVESMKERISAFQEYQKLIGGEDAIDISDLAKGYDSVLKDWDTLAETYGQYKTADAFNTVRKKTELEKKFSHEDGSGYTFDEVQKELKKYAPDSDEYKYLSTYTNYSDLNDFNKAMESNEFLSTQNQIAALKAEKEKMDAEYKAKGGYVPSASNYNRPAYSQIDAYEKWRAKSFELENKIKELEDSGYYGELNKKKNLHELEHKVDLYKPEYEGKDDFEENSQYVTTIDENKKPGIFTPYAKYGDPDYEYINNVNGSRDEIQWIDEAINKDGNGYESVWQQRGYDLLREDEIAIYNYKYNVEGKKSAAKFLDDMETVLSKRRTDKLSKRWEENAEKTPILSNVATVITKPAGAIVGALGDAVNALQGKDYNPYSYSHTLSNFVTDTREYTGEDIAESTEGFELLGQNIPSFLYNTGMSMADSAYGIATFGKASSFIMGTSAFQDKAKEMVEAGEGQDVIWKSAITSGVAETLFEHIGIDNLFKIKSVDSLSGAVKAALKQAGAESFEEIGTEITNIIADDVIRGKDSELYKMYNDLIARGYSEKEALSKTALKAGSQVAWAGIGGALSGGVMGGVAGANNYVENKTQGKTIRENERVGDLLEIASMTPQESEAYKAYTEYANRGINADNITDAQLGNLRGITETDALETLASKDGLFKKGATVEQKKSAVETLHKLNKADTDNVAVKKAKELTKDLKIGDNTEITETGKSAQIKGIKIDTNEVITSEGETLSENDVTFSERDQELLGYAKQMDETTANLFLEIDDGQAEVTQYKDSFDLAMDYAKHDFTQETILENKGVLSNSQVSAIYKATVINTYKAKQAAIDELNSKHGNAFTIQGKVDDSVIDYDNTGAEGKVAWNSLNTSQRKAITFMKGLARATGMNLKLISNGMEEGINGAYKISENTIILDIYAGMDKVEGTDFSDTIIPTASHEMTHWMKEKAPALYRAVDELIFKTLKKSGDAEQDILNRRRLKMQENHPDKEFSDEEVRDEVIARACEDMLAMSEEGKKLFDSLSETEKKTFVEKIQEIIQNLKEWVYDLLSHYKSNSPEAREMRKYQESLEELSKLWDEMLKQAIQTNQSLAKEGITGEELAKSVGQKNTTSLDDVKFQTRSVNGNEVVWIERNILKENDGLPVHQFIANFIAEHIGDVYTLIESGQKVYIGEDLPSEYTQSKYTQKILKNNPNIVKVKNKASVNLGEMIEIATNRRWEKTEHPKNKDAKYGMYRYDTRFGFPVMNNQKQIVGANVYTAELVIRNASNGKKYLYDIVKIKKDTVSSEWLTKQTTSAADSTAGQKNNVSKDIIGNPKENVKENYAKYSDRDTLGNNLTKEQQFYFAESKVRDESGNLKVMYHGTPNATFTKFRSGTYFTEHKWYADNYQSQGASSLGYKKTADNPDTYAVYLNIKKPFDTRNKKERDIFKNEYYRQWGTGTDLMESGLPDWLDGQDLQEFLEEQGYDYDGLILDEGGMGGYGDEVVNRGLSYVVFSPEQVKSVENKTPTNDSDYRFSDRDTLEDLNAQLKEKQNQIYSASMELRKFDAKAEEDKLYSVMRRDGVSKEELDGALQEYSKWSTESGYGEVSERLSTLKDEEKTLRREIQKVEDRLHDELKEQISNFSDEDIQKYVSKAVRKYHTTSRLENASYLLTTGSMLDFSDGQGYRVKDHREISEILDLPDYAEYSDGMIAFMNMGNIRLQTYGIDISAMPNAKQISALRDIIFKVMREYDEFSVDFSKTNGYSDGSVTYGKGTSTSKIVADIKNYFETGVVPEEQSGIRDFLYSDRDSDWNELSAEQSYRNDYQERLIAAQDMADEAKGYGKRIKINYYLGAVKVYHGTSIENFESIRSSAEIKSGTFFAINKQDAEYYAKIKHKKGIVLELYLDARDLEFAAAGAELYSALDLKNINGIYTSNHGIRYSDRDNVSSYETMGELSRLRKENDKFKADIERLKERLALERQVTGGTTFNRNQLDSVAGHIRNLANSDYSKKELVKLLDDVYTYIITSKELTWDDLYSKLYDVSKTVLEESRLKKVDENGYFKQVLKDIRSKKISLSDVQKQELESAYGISWNKAVFGRLNVSDNATMDLDSQWSEWANVYPGLFDAETTEGDQIIKLLEMYDDLKDGSEIYEDLNNEDMTRWLANEIYNQYWNVSTIKTTADKYAKQIKMLNWKHREAMKELRDNHEERLAKQKLADKSKYSEIIKKIRQRKEEEIQEVRKLGKERLNRYKEEAARKTRIQSITSQALTLNEWLIKNSKDKHIHESLKGPVVTLLQAIDFSSKQLLGMKGSSNKGTPTRKDISLQKALGKVQKMMADANVGMEELVELYGHDLDASIESMIKSVDAIAETMGDNEFVLNQMTLEDLITLDNVVKTIKHAVTKMNKFHIVHHAKGISNLAQETIIDVDKLGKAKIFNSEKMKGKVQKLLNWRNTVPYYAFKRFGSSGQKIFEAFQDGWDKLAFNVKEIIDFTNNAYNSKDVRDWEEELHTFNLRVPATEYEMASPGFEPQYQEVQMTTAQIMHLYLLNMRDAAKTHLLGGGIRVSDIETKKGNVISQTEGVIFEQNEIDSIIDSLTPEQKKVANKLSEFMNTVASDWGNEVSMARFGYKAFTETNYVPIQADKNNLAVDDETEKGNSLFKLLNMSFTKSLVDNANNRIVISSLFDVFAQHSSDMAKYNALALPVLDAFRWFNYKEKGQMGKQAFITKSVKTSIENAFGKDGQSYITTFLKDINGQENVTRDTIGKGFFKNAKIASVGANIRVALLQPTAYLKASANIDNKYLTKALFHKPKIAKAEKYCGMALWKSMGYFDTNVQRGVAEQIKHAETSYDKWVERSMKGAEVMDKLTFGYLWNASELEIRDKRKDLKPGSDEFFYEVGKRLRDIIYSTQVVDSTLTRSEMMRSNDGWDKMLMVFASEPTLAYNMLQDAYMEISLEAKRLKQAGEQHSGRKAFAKHGKRMARVYVAYTMTNIVAAMIESGFDVLRDDDDEEMNLAEFMKLYLQNFADNQMILTKIPIAKDLVSALQGFTSTRTDTQWMASFSNTLKQVMKLVEGDGNPVKLIKNTLQTFSYFFGLPFYNAYRDIMATLNKLEILTPEDLEELLSEFMD